MSWTVEVAQYCFRKNSLPQKREHNDDIPPVLLQEFTELIFKSHTSDSVGKQVKKHFFSTALFSIQIDNNCLSDIWLSE